MGTVRKTRLTRIAVALGAAAVLVACSPGGGGAAPELTATSSPVPSAAPTPTPAPTHVPSPSPDPPTDEARAAELVAGMSTIERAGVVVMGHAPGTDPAALVGLLESGPQGLILMGDNVAADPDAQRLMSDEVASSITPAPLIAIDEEGGDVTRLPWDDLPSARDLKGADPSAVTAAFDARADLLGAAGITVNFGIVADVPPDEGSFIFSRAYGTDPEIVADAVRAAVAGEGDRILSTLKHFPGHGAASGDSHSSIPTTDETYDEWMGSDAVPFAAGIDEGAELVMVGHLRFTGVDERPASLSPEWYRILRDDLGFEGVAVTDDLGMLTSSGEAAYADPVANATSALGAGADLVLTVVGASAEEHARIVDGIAAATERGEIPADRLAEAAERVMTLRLAADPGE
ncbi:MAG: glycoside hydrolase family 3 N-terminal domain-containing protein [Microbacterium gubbeenense]|uniref:glycoside hydrolase family 3 N-terminal domain-containing protein n=1 Tax=Microbacterium gubbeenense TaxID=159896 RepID=UPI003F9BA0DA